MDTQTDSLLTIRLLCVEDEDEDWADLQTTLASARTYALFDISWERCKSLRQAKVLLESGGYDVILLDLKLVDSVNPLDTTRAISEVATPLGIPIVILSGLQDDPVVTRECSLAGAFQHLQKGRYDAIDLSRAIDLSYERSQEFKRQLDLYLKAQKMAAENLALAEQATGVLSGLRSDLRNFTRNDRSRRMVYSVLISVFLLIGAPSLESGTFKFKATSESVGLMTLLMGMIWSQGNFHERLRQSRESMEIIDEIRNRKNG